MTTRHSLLLVFLSLLLTIGCGDENGNGDGDAGGGMDGGAGQNDGGGDGTDGGGDGTDGGGDGMDGGDGTDANVTVLNDGAVLLPDGGVITGPSGPITCQGHLYQCGDTLDNDEDGLTDDRDPDCLGPCDNNESGFFLGIPGGGAAPCKKDCYFDQDTGGGNDTCEWDHRCDELEPSLAEGCPFTGPTGPARCPAEQEPTCAEICSPLVPNGCDCFGCCELPAGSGTYRYIGSLDADGNPTCALPSEENPDDWSGCNPCTPVGNCLNECGECELCLGRTAEDLPEHCFPPTTSDGGTPPPVDAGTLPDGAPAPQPDGGTPPPPTCDDGRQACGFEGLPPCPSGYFCLTGCCTFFG